MEIKCPFGIKDTKTFLEAINSKKVYNKKFILLLKYLKSKFEKCKMFLYNIF